MAGIGVNETSGTVSVLNCCRSGRVPRKTIVDVKDDKPTASKLIGHFKKIRVRFISAAPAAAVEAGSEDGRLAAGELSFPPALFVVQM